MKVMSFLQYTGQHLFVIFLINASIKSKIMMYIMSYDSMLYGME